MSEQLTREQALDAIIAEASSFDNRVGGQTAEKFERIRNLAKDVKLMTAYGGS